MPADESWERGRAAVRSRPTVHSGESRASGEFAGLLEQVVAGVRLRARPTALSNYPADTRLFRIFILTHGRWRDLPSLLSRNELAHYWSFGDDELELGVSSDFLNPSLRMGMSNLLEAAAGGLPLQVLTGQEPFVIETCLSEVEKKLELVASALNGLLIERPDSGDAKIEEGSREGNADAQRAEAPKVKAPVVNSSWIASAVQTHKITDTSAWKSISQQFPGVNLFAVDADPRSFEVSEEGYFEGSANVLVSVPSKARSGRTTNLSLTIPTRVFGNLSPQGQITVSEFKL
jgi:hypothetical protein